jgi:DMSO reductase anchor subunit
VLPAQVDSRAFYGGGSLLALGLLAAGLLASLFHLGRPERGWRAAAQWRTSWLSREVIALPAFMGSVLLYGAIHSLGWNPVLLTLGQSIAVELSLVAGALAVVLALTLFLCTGMIYAAIRFLQEWASPLTVINYLLLGAASGFTLATGFSLYTAPNLMRFYGIWAIILTLAALVSRGAALWRNARLQYHSNLQTAIGVRHPHIAQMAQGAMGGSFNTREFFHGRSSGVLHSVKWLFLILVFVVPVILLAIGLEIRQAPILLGAFVGQYLGLLAERWFFFAQARHPQNLYYQTV